MESSTPSDASIALPTPSLEDLAISFITDAIRSVSPDHHMAAKSVPTSQVPPPPKTISAWETKQKRLERHILESKALMTQLGEARTKTERDQILGLLREKNRLMDSEADGRQEDGQDKYNVTPRPGFSRHGSSRWPETSYEATVLIVSDDEDEEEEEEEEADAVEGMVC
ncbi:hypothetical protein BD410DRAFT_785074 [Rickenella mellea]|uniref:Uncharacterized protein n=1 Tax=Rickenella mellea TaxID=50990 RepID=A0A4Y7QBZ2_9AGAM|nr:hypothetical protein BD410DRAFT_785074 [Rickenella mellea]